MHCPLFWLYMYTNLFFGQSYFNHCPLSVPLAIFSTTLCIYPVQCMCIVHSTTVSFPTFPYICLSLHPSVSASISLAHSLYLCLSPSIYICVYLTHSPTLSVSLALSVYVCLCLCFVYPTLVTLIRSDSVCPSFCLSVSLSLLTISRELS